MSKDESIKEILLNIRDYMQKSIDNGYHKFVYNDLGYDMKCVDIINAIETILDLYKELQNENARLKYLLRESSKIIDEYTNETENDTKKIIEYRKKYLEKGDKMSEDETRKILLCENILELAYCGLLDKLDESNHNDLNELKKQAIQGLLDLYQKEKEENKELEIRLQEEINEVCKLKTELYGNSISKDKIKEKIESIENTFEICDEELNYKLKIEDKAKIEVLKELLEEE